jgi:hypothetical protein
MWLRVVGNDSGYLNTNDILFAQLRANDSGADVFPLVSGQFRGKGYPYSIADAESFRALRKVMAGWCDMGEGMMLNVNRFAHVYVSQTVKDNEAFAKLYLSDVLLTEPIQFSGDHARRVKAYLDSGAQKPGGARPAGRQRVSTKKKKRKR